MSNPPILVSLTGLLKSESNEQINGELAKLHLAPDPVSRRELARSLAEDLPVDRQSYLIYDGNSRTEIMDRLYRWFNHRQQPVDDPVGRAAIGIAVITLCGLEQSERLRTLESADIASAAACARCGNILSDPTVRNTLVNLYSEHDQRQPDALTTRLNDERMLTFYRHGSTSIVLSAKGKAGETLALKLVLLPFLRISEIGEATRNYADTYELQPHDETKTSALMKVYASGNGWILSSFHEGSTLAGWISNRDRKTRWTSNPIRALRFRKETAHKDDNVSVSDATHGEVERRAENRLFLDDLWRIAEVVIQAVRQYQEAVAFAVDPTKRPPAHGDLTPSNIVIRQNGSNYSCWLIDYGVNYLYAYLSSSGVEHNAMYVAPEMRRGRPTDPSATADFFSLGQIMIELLGIPPNRDGTVPDIIYAWHPALARLLEDMLDPDSNYRGRLCAPNGTPVLEEISEYVHFEADIAEKSHEAPDFSSHGFRRLFFFFWPLSGELARQKRIWDLLKDRSFRADSWSEHSVLAKGFGAIRRLISIVTSRPSAQWAPKGQQTRQVSYIERRLEDAKTSFAWSRWWAALLFLGFSVVLYYTGIDLGRPAPVPYWLELALSDTSAGSLAELLKLPTYDLPDWSDNWPARIVAGTYVLLAAKLYFNIYARLLPTTVPGEPRLSRRARLAALWMRGLPPFNFVLVMMATVVHSGLWPLATAIGQIGIAWGNYAVVGYLDECYESARRKPPGDASVPVWSVERTNTQITGNDLIRSWRPSSLVYAIVCVAVCIGIYTHQIVDVWLYASMVAFVNIFLFFVQKCGLDGPRIRIALTRAEVAAERVGLRNSDNASHSR